MGPARWCLAGSVASVAPLTAASHSLKLIRRVDGLSPQIRFAMNAGSTVPVVDINTPSGTLTLVNAKIVKAGPVPPGAPHPGARSHEISQFGLTFMPNQRSQPTNQGLTDNWNLGGGTPHHDHTSGLANLDIEEIELTFMSIQFPRKKNRGLIDDWKVGG
jgi:hypothetical protein